MEAKSSWPSTVPETEICKSSDEDEQPALIKLTPDNNTVLLRISAVRVMNLGTGKSAPVYQHYDSTLQASLISNRGVSNWRPTGQRWPAT